MSIGGECLQWAGAATGALGALWLALKVDSSRWGFVCYLLSNVCWVIYALQSAQWPLLLMNAVFTVITMVGLIRWFVPGSVRASWRGSRGEDDGIAGRTTPHTVLGPDLRP